MIEFAQIYCLLLIPVILYFLFRERNKSHLKFSSVSLLKEATGKKPIKAKIGKIFLFLGLSLLVVALARPQVETKRPPDYEKGIDIALLLDVSGSMESVDFKPNRLEVAKKTISDFVEERHNDRLSFIVFGGSAYTKIPLTLDHAIVEQSLESVTVDAVAEQGTAIGMAISVGVNRLKKSDASSKVMVLVTDGENNAGAINPRTASGLAKDLGIKIYTIGVGTDQTILPYEVFGQTKYQTYEGGLDEGLLTQIAEDTGGRYYRALDETSLSQIFEAIDQLEKTDFEGSTYKHYEELAFGFIQLGLVIALLGVLLDQFIFIQIP